MGSSPFIHQRDASNEGSGDEDNDGSEIEAGAWVEGVWQDPLDPHPLPLREGRSTVDFDPDYNPNPREVMPNIISAQYLLHIFISAPEAETTTSGSQSKKRRGERGRNQYLEGKWRVNVVSLVGECIEAPMVRSKFRNAIGAIIRTKEILDPSISDWLLVPEGRKEAMWKLLKQTFILPRLEELRKQLGEVFHRWRGELNHKYVKKGLSPLMNKGASHHPNGIFHRQVPQDREAAIAAGQPDPFEGLDEHGWQWLAARKPTIVDGKPTFSTVETNQMAEKIYDFSERQRKGESVPNRDKDVLSSALGTKEHGGRVRGVSSKLSIKDGFERDRASYKSHSRYKEDLREAAEKALQTRFKTSVGSTIAQPYPIDSICINTPCSLHISVGRAGKTKEVAKGLAIPVDCLFEGKPIPRYYACVTVLEINSNYGDHEIDIPTAEGVHCLGQSVGNTILRHKRDIILSSEKAKYLDPCAIYKVRHSFLNQWGDNHDKLAKYKTKKDKRAKRGRQHKKAMRRVSSYITYMILWQDRHYIWALYNFQGHWIAFMIQPKSRVVTIFDSLDYDQSTYKEFIFLLQKLVNFLLCTLTLCKFSTTLPMEEFITPRDQKKWLYAQTSMPQATIWFCGYYVCEHIRMLGRYTTDPERASTSRLHEQQLLNIGVDLCRFILREAVNPMGTYYHPEHELAQEDKYVSLREWENQEYRQG
uniref:DUF8039 domain-containing protein n=1 Tax=Setaria italica TaxID=4555 RepID=K3ZEJ1_SETIT